MRGITAARKWYDEGVSAIFDVGITSVALGVQELARDKNKLAIYLSSASSDLTGKNCSPNGIHWTYNNYSQALGVTIRQTISNSLIPSRRAAWMMSSGKLRKNCRNRKMANTDRKNGSIIEK